MTLLENPLKTLKHIATAQLPTPFALFTVHAYKSSDGKEHLAMTLGDLSGSGKNDPVVPGQLAPLVRVHSECLTGDALFSLRCDCGFQLRAALEAIAREGRGGDSGVEGFIVNFAAYSHTSIALHDALKSAGLPAVEVHISDIKKREVFRQTSMTAGACIAMISGQGFPGYVLALQQLAKL